MTRLVFALGGIGAVAGLAAALLGLALGAGPVAWAAIAVGWAAGAAAAPWAAGAAAAARAEALQGARAAVERLTAAVSATAEAGGHLSAACRDAAGAAPAEAPWEAVAASCEAAGDAQNEACLAACRLSATLGADPAGAEAARLAEDLRRSADRFLALRDDVRARVGRSEEAAERLREAAREAEMRRADLDKVLKILELRFAEVRSSLDRGGTQGAGESGR